MKRHLTLPVVAAVLSWGVLGLFLWAGATASRGLMAATVVAAITALGLEIHLLRCRLQGRL